MAIISNDRGQDIQRILVIRRDNIGDLICTTPLLQTLRHHYPHAWIGVLANQYNAPVLQGHPAVDDVLAYQKAKHRAPGISRWSVWWATARLLGQLRLKGVDLAIVASSGGERFARLVGARRTIADKPTGRHEVENCMALLAPLGITDSPGPVSIHTDAACRDRMAQRLPSGFWGPVLGVHLSARKPSQRWPEDRFAELIRRLLANGVGVMLLWAPGSAADPAHPGDDEKAAAVRARVGDATAALAAVATTTLPELVAALSLVDGMVCADGGAMHLAAGLGKPVVALFGGSDATRWHPWGVPYRVLQPPSREVVDVSLDDVLAAACELFAITNSG